MSKLTDVQTKILRLKNQSHRLSGSEVTNLHQITMRWVEPEQLVKDETWLHQTLMNIDDDYKLEELQKRAANLEKKISLSGLKTPEAVVQIHQTGSAKEQSLQEEIERLVEQVEQLLREKQKLAQKVVEQEDTIHWQQVEISGRQQTSAVIQRARKVHG